MDSWKKWTRNETILAFDLYCKTPFGKIHKSNPNIVKLATLIGRTPAAVSLKMANLGSCDPALKARNIKGMQHGSKLDAEIFEEFYKNTGELEIQAKRIRSELFIIEDKLDCLFEDIQDWPAGRYKEQIINARIGQRSFRTSVLIAYDNRCCITGIRESALLIASHIKPWKISDEKTERTNPCNGLCLNAFHDKAFDRGLITIDNKYQIIVSKHLRDVEMDFTTKEWLMSYQGKTISVPNRFFPGKDFIEYHNEKIFWG